MKGTRIPVHQIGRMLANGDVVITNGATAEQGTDGYLILSRGCTQMHADKKARECGQRKIRDIGTLMAVRFYLCASVCICG